MSGVNVENAADIEEGMLQELARALDKKILTGEGSLYCAATKFADPGLLLPAGYKTEKAIQVCSVLRGLDETQWDSDSCIQSALLTVLGTPTVRTLMEEFRASVTAFESNRDPIAADVAGKARELLNAKHRALSTTFITRADEQVFEVLRDFEDEKLNSGDAIGNAVLPVISAQRIASADL